MGSLSPAGGPWDSSQSRTGGWDDDGLVDLDFCPFEEVPVLEDAIAEAAKGDPAHVRRCWVNLAMVRPVHN